MQRLKGFFILTAVLLLPGFSLAETVVRIGDAIVVDSGQVVDGDYYVSVGPFGNTTMSGTVNGDMYALGGSVTTNGAVAADVFIVSGVSQLHASVTDDVRMVTGEAIVAEPIGGDLFVIGGTLKVLSTASVGGDVYFFGGSGEIDGSVGGSVHGTMQQLRVNGSVGGSIDVRAVNGLTLGSRASIEGDVKTTSMNDLVRSPEAVVEGKVSSEKSKVTDQEDNLRSALIPLFITLFAALSLYLLFRHELVSVTDAVRTAPTRTFLVGVAVLLLGPVVSILLMATVLGLLVGVLAAGVTIALYALGYALGGITLGVTVLDVLKRPAQVNLGSITLGTVLLYAISWVPVLGPALVLLAVAATVGGLTLSLYRQLA